MKMWQFGITFAVLSCAAYAQGQGLSDPFKKWLVCDASFPFSTETVSPDFSVKLSSEQAPVAGIRVLLVRGGEEWKPGDDRTVATAGTDSDGTAWFEAIAPGNYHLRAADGLLFPNNDYIEVEAGHRSGEEVKVYWPGESTKIRALRGRLTTSKDPSDEDVPLRDSAVDLLDLVTGRHVESARTDVGGLYEFATAEPGLYVFRVTLAGKENSNKSDSRDLAIELDPSAREATLPEMKVVRSDCYGVQLYRFMKVKGWEPQ